MNETQSNQKTPKRFVVYLKEWTLGIKPGRYNVTESNKGYRLWLTKTMWVGLPRQVVERNPRIFKIRRSRIDTNNH